MKNIYFLLIGLMILQSCHSDMGQPREQRFERLKKEFKNPSKEFRSAPLWVWNTKVTYADIDRMLQEFKDAGFGGAFVHPRPGMITEYLSNDWLNLYRYSVDAGKKLGLDIWIYDENSYPSGFAGGHVPAEMPESYNQGQGLSMSKTEILPEDVDSYFICLKKEHDAFLDITSSTNKYKDVKGEYYLYAKTYNNRGDWYGGYSYVDLLYPGVTEKFIDITMKGYEKTFKEELGTTIKGIFTDEPNIASSGGLRWTPDLFDMFKKQWGYDLKDVLPLLKEETGNWKQVRHNYTETLLQLFIDRWAKPWFNYCEQKNLLWTGHYWEHGWPDMSHGGDNMAMYAWHQMPAIDMLFNQFDDVSPQAQFGNIRAVKEVRSATNQMGYTRTLSETYGGGGWEETFEDFKRLGDWEYVLGVNFMNQHLSHMTLTGARKYDYPPVFTSHSPWWPNYETQNDYFARLSLLLSQGEQMNDILVIEPTSSIWLYYSYIANHSKVGEIGNNFQAFVTKLEKSQVEYDLGSENIIKDQGSVQNGVFVVGKRSYKKVVLPPMTESLNRATFKLLEEFVNSGGELITFSIPTLVDGKEDSNLAALMKQNIPNIKLYTDLSEQVLNQTLNNDKIRFTGIVSNNLYHQRRTFDDGELVFLVNSSLTENATGIVSLVGKYLIELDAMSGEMYAYPNKEEGKNTVANFDLPPAGSLLLFSSKSADKTSAPKPQIANKSIVVADSETVVKRIRDNALTIDFCNLIIDGQKKENLHIATASYELFRHFGLQNGDPWNSSIQYRQTIVEKDTFKTGDIRVQYSFVVARDVDKNKICLVAEQPQIWGAKINGKEVSAVGGEYWLDPYFGVYNIGSEVKDGLNVVELTVSPMSIFAEIEPIYILGDFALESAAKGWTIKAPVEKFELGSWKQQGQPFYSWEMSYSKDYKIRDTSARYALKLDNWNGTLAEVFVNAEKAGVIAYQPYELDITGWLKEGNNNIDVRVIGSLKNLLGPHHNNPGKGISGPWHWKNIKDPVSGDKYQMLDYGLMNDFVLMSSK